MLRQHTSKRIVLIVVLASLLSHSIVQACEPIEPTILVRCSNLETAILAYQQVETGDTREDIKRRQANNTVDNLLAIIPNCAEDLVPVVDIFEQEIIKWLNHENKRGAFLDRNLVLEPYATDRYSQLQKNKNSLLSCGYEEFRHHDDWLISFETNRPYCGLFGIIPGGCPNIIFSSSQFLVYLVTNININTIPYMIGLLLTGAAIVGVWRRTNNLTQNSRNSKRSVGETSSMLISKTISGQYIIPHKKTHGVKAYCLNSKSDNASIRQRPPRGKGSLLPSRFV